MFYFSDPHTFRSVADEASKAETALYGSVLFLSKYPHGTVGLKKSWKFSNN